MGQYSQLFQALRVAIMNPLQQGLKLHSMPLSFSG